MLPIQGADDELVNGISRISIASPSATSSSSALSSSSTASPEQVMQLLSALIAPLVTKSPWGFYQRVHDALANNIFKTDQGEQVLTRRNLEKPEFNGLCHFYLKDGRHMVMKEVDFARYRPTITQQIDPTRLPASHFYSIKYDSMGASAGVDCAAIDMIAEVQQQILTCASHLAGEELLMHLTVFYLLSQFHRHHDPAATMCRMVSLLGQLFFQGHHEPLFESLYSPVDWFLTITNNLNLRTKYIQSVPDSQRGGYILSGLAECQKHIAQTILVKSRSGLFTQSALKDPAISHRTRFLDWYMLCTHISKLNPKACVAHGFAETVRDMHCDSIPLFVSMCSVLETVLRGEALSTHCIASIADPEMTLEKWMKTPFFSNFCLKVLLYFPDMSSDSASTGLLRGLCMYAPHYLGNPEHEVCINHFTADPWFTKCAYENKSTLVQLLQMCHAAVQKPSKKTTIYDWCRHMSQDMEPESLPQEVVRAIVSLPGYEEHLLYFLSILSVCYVKDKQKPQVETTIESWQRTGVFILFCVNVLLAIDDLPLQTTFLYSYLASGLDFLDVLSIQKVDIRPMVQQLTEKQFGMLSDSVRAHPRSFFPAFLENTQISVAMRCKALDGIAEKLSVTFEYLNECFKALVQFSSEVTKEDLKAVLGDFALQLLCTPWGCPLLVNEKVPLTCSDLITKKALVDLLGPVHEQVLQLAPNHLNEINAAFARKLIAAILEICSRSAHALPGRLYPILRHIRQHYYPVLEALLPSRDLKRSPLRQAVQGLLSPTYFMPLCFPANFSRDIVVSIHGVDSEKNEEIVVRKFHEITDLGIGLTTAFVKEQESSLKLSEMYCACIHRFVNEIGVQAKHARDMKYTEKQCRDLVICKNALLHVIADLYKKIEVPALKQECFVKISDVHRDEKYRVCPTHREELSPTSFEGGSMTFRAENRAAICLESPSM